MRKVCTADCPLVIDLPDNFLHPSCPWMKIIDTAILWIYSQTYIRANLYLAVTYLSPGNHFPQFTAISRRKVVGKNVHATIPKGIMGYDQHTLPNTVLSNLLLLLSFSTRKHTSMTSHAILSNFFEEQWAQNHTQYLSGLSRALFPTTFLEIAAYCKSDLY